MTKKELEQLKKELKAEIIQELKEEKAIVGKGKDFDFHQYKEEVVTDDIQKIKNFCDQKLKWYFFIPIVGFAIYMYQYNQALTSIDRGVLRQNINKAMLKWLWLDVPFYYITWFAGVFNYLPFTYRKALRRAVEMTEEK